MSDLNRRLKSLRAGATPPLSLEQMAAELGLESRQAYHFYERENGFKQRYLPMDFARRVARVLSNRGVNPDDVLALAGIGIDEATTPELSAGQEQWLDLFDKLTAEQRSLLMQLAHQMIAPGPPADDAPGTVHAPQRSYAADTEAAR